MHAYLRVGEGGELPLDEPVGIYRDPGDAHRLVASVGGTEHRLSVSDPTVSRRSDSGPPIEIVPRDRWVEVHNNGNENGVDVATSEGTETVRDGFASRIERDATLEIGARTRLQIVVEREAGTEEYNVTHEGDGDVVMGDKSVTTHDERTSVGDNSVIEGDVARDVEASDGGDDESESYCDRHDRTFNGAVCPDCASQLN